MNKEDIKNFTITVLDMFLGIPETLYASFDRKNFYKIMQGNTTDRQLTVSNICKIFHQLKASEYIEVDNINGNESIRFTNKAKLKVIDTIAKNRSSDTKYHFVSFDIPERLKKNRDKFRRSIKKMGFAQVQQSLWVTNRDIGDLVEMASCEYEVNDYVVYFISENTNIDKHLNHIFKK